MRFRPRGGAFASGGNQHFLTENVDHGAGHFTSFFYDFSYN
jgi:hypothetical protein